MFADSVGYELWGELVGLSAMEASQRWILSAMQKHGPELVRMLWRILGNEQDVCDAYQSTFLQLAHYQGRQKPIYVKAYLFRTASNTAISMLRHKMAEKKTLSKATSNAEVTQCHVNEINCKCLVETLRHYIAQLPEHLRAVITLRDLAELPYVEVSRILSISPATARVYRCKAIQLLAVWMNK
jgi:RNA polymerase sigma factor (sigma-70 family)